MKAFVVTGKLPERDELKRTLEKQFPNHEVKFSIWHPTAPWVMVKESFLTVVCAHVYTPSILSNQPSIHVSAYTPFWKLLLTGLVGLFVVKYGARINNLVDEVTTSLAKVYGDVDNII